MTTKEEIKGFLRNFHEKMQFWDVVFLDSRGKNTQALADLELRPNDRKKVLEDLKVEDYSQGPLDEQWYGSSTMWVFGKKIKKHELYIKVTMGVEKASVICISFHVAEYPIDYPFRIKK